jgi:hypothetical protein
MQPSRVYVRRHRGDFLSRPVDRGRSVPEGIVSSKASKKQLRQQAAAAEMQRRYRDAERQSPLSREQLDDLLDHLAEQLAAGGFGKTFEHTSQWLSEHGHSVENSLEFFRSRRMADDWEVAIGADPHKLFGPTETQCARMPIPHYALEELQAYLKKRLPEVGCDNSRRLTREWLERGGWPVRPTEFALIAQGGGCDCEVVGNVEPSNIYLE